MRTFTQRLCAAAVFILVVCSVSLSFAGETRERRAVAASEQWLSLVDEHHYAQSWSAAASFFRNAVSEDTWIRQISTVRPALGKVISRKLTSTMYRTSLPGAPDGEYVVIQYETSFENKKSAVETVTPMLDNDGTWRVSGYYIR